MVRKQAQQLQACSCVSSSQLGSDACRQSVLIDVYEVENDGSANAVYISRSTRSTEAPLSPLHSPITCTHNIPILFESSGTI